MGAPVTRIDIPLDYLLSCSKQSLQNIRMSQMNLACERRRIAHEAIEAAIQAEATARFVEWIDRCGEELITLEKAS